MGIAKYISGDQKIPKFAENDWFLSLSSADGGGGSSDWERQMSLGWSKQ